MRKRALGWVVPLVLAGCGGGGKSPEPTPTASPAEAVIRDWTDSVRAGNFDHANHLFATPSVIENGTGKIRLESLDQVDAFNRSLPCGAILKSTQEQADHYTLATFKLVEAGLGRHCDGAGHLARVSFLIKDGRIREWLRVGTQPPSGSRQT